jgi:hypothetical protein
MPLHLLKVCVGIDSIEALAAAQARRRKGGRDAVFHYTRHMPRRDADILDGGSLYWIIKGFVQVRQRILGLSWQHFEDEGRYCAIKLERKLVPTELQARRPHQGWRYLESADAPRDLKSGRGAAAAKLPPGLLAELKSLGLL